MVGKGERERENRVHGVKIRIVCTIIVSMVQFNDMVYMYRSIANKNIITTET